MCKHLHVTTSNYKIYVKEFRLRGFIFINRIKFAQFFSNLCLKYSIKINHIQYMPSVIF